MNEIRINKSIGTNSEKEKNAFIELTEYLLVQAIIIKEYLNE